MQVNLGSDEEAMLVLLSLQPVSAVPRAHVRTVRRLADKGLAVELDGTWHPTGRGLETIGQRLH